MISSWLVLFQMVVAPQPPLPSQEFCTPTGEQHAAAPVDDAYTVIGREPMTQRLYSGTLSAHFSNGQYLLKRRVGRVTTVGYAQSVLCGPDKVPLLRVRYRTTPRTELYCKVSVDYDNYSVANCGPNSSSHQIETGLEAWFPSGAP